MANQFGLDTFDAEDLSKLSFLPVNFLNILECYRGSVQAAIATGSILGHLT